jgi:hypothetical protein
VLAALDVALLGLPKSKLGLLVAEAIGFCAVGAGFCTPGLGETRGGGADVKLQPLTIPRIRAIAPNCRNFLMLHRSLASPVLAYQQQYACLKNAAIDRKGNRRRSERKLVALKRPNI